MQLTEQVDFFREQKKRIEAELLRESRKHEIVRILETAPGIGPIRAARLVPIVVTPHRFRTKRQFWSYCGLGIVTRSSSDWVQTADGGWIRARVPQTRGLSRQYDRVLKDIFKGAATLVITQRNKGPLYPRYERMLAGGTKPSLAKLTLARTIAATVLRMWRERRRRGHAEAPGEDLRAAGVPARHGRGGLLPRHDGLDRHPRRPAAHCRPVSPPGAEAAPPNHIAVVTDTDLGRGMTRLFSAWAELSNQRTTRAFSTLEAACDWIDECRGRERGTTARCLLGRGS